jgi:hypothetical protein
MMMTPYTGSNGRIENASILRGIDTITWVEPKEKINPLVAQPPKHWQNNSDPDLNWDAKAKRYFYSNRLASLDSNVVSVSGTADGTRFTKAHRIVSVRSHAIVSPSFTVGHDGGPRLYSVNATHCGDNNAIIEMRPAVGPVGRYENLTWGSPSTVKWNQPIYVPWHLEIRYVAELSLYVGLISAHPINGSCAEDDLFLATSTDGVNFQSYPHPVMWRKNPWREYRAVYRSSFVYDSDKRQLRIWASALTLGWHWRLLYLTVSWDGLIKRLTEIRETEGFGATYQQFIPTRVPGADGARRSMMP